MIIDFVPRKTDLVDWKNKSKNDWMNMAKNIENTNNLGINTIHNSTLSYIQKIMNEWFTATHQYLKFPKEEKEKILNKYNNFQSIIKNFMGVKIGYNKDQNSTIFNKPISEANLSEE